MATRPRTSSLSAVGLLFVACSVGGEAWAGTAASTRPPSGGGGGAASGRAAAPAGSPGYATGRATYGHGYGYSYGWPGYGYAGYPYYGYGWYGWPYGAWGSWWWGAGLYAPVQVIQVPMAEGSQDLPAAVETDVSPGKAAVRLDGEDVGRAKDYRGTWNKLVMSPGPHTLEFAAEGYQTLRIELDARPGRIYRVEDALVRGEGLDPRSASEASPVSPAAAASPAMRQGRLRLAGASPDAAIFLDGGFLASGRDMAALHGALPVAPGEHVVDVVQPGFRRKSIRVDVIAGETVALDLTLDEPEADEAP